MKMAEAGEAWFAALRRRGRSARTIKWYAMWLRDLAGSLLFQDVEQVTLADLRRWVDGLQARRLSPYSVRGAVATVQAWCRWLVAEGVLSDNPSLRLERPALPERLPGALETGEVLALLNVAAMTTHPERDVALVAFLTETGCRVGEMVGLTLDRLHVEAGIAVVVGKGNKQRFVPFNGAAQKTLRAWLAVRPALLGTLFGLKETGVRLLLKRLAAKAHIDPKRIHPHVFRHTSATLRVEAGGETADLAQIYGWKDEGMLRVYAQLAKERLAKRAAATSPLDRLMSN